MKKLKPGDLCVDGITAMSGGRAHGIVVGVVGDRYWVLLDGPHLIPSYSRLLFRWEEFAEDPRGCEQREKSSAQL